MVTSEIWLTPAKNVYISEYYPDKNFNYKEFLYTNRFRGEGDIYRTLLQFDLCDSKCNNIPPNSTIQRATLVLPIDRNEVACENNLLIYRIIEKWCECDATWNHQPRFAVPPAGCATVQAGDFGTLCIDVTCLVKSWYDGFSKNFGLMLTCDECRDSLLGFWSTRYFNSDLWPRLRIDYYENCCECPPDNCGCGGNIDSCGCGCDGNISSCSCSVCCNTSSCSCGCCNTSSCSCGCGGNIGSCGCNS